MTSKQSVTVTLLPMDLVFEITSEGSVLEAALRQSVRLPYRCGIAHCGACRYRISTLMGDAVDFCLIVKADLRFIDSS